MIQVPSSWLSYVQFRIIEVGDEINKMKRRRGVYRGIIIKTVNEIKDIMNTNERVIDSRGRNRLTGLKSNLEDNRC